MMNQPVQNPPVDRLYMRPIVGRQGLPERPGEPLRKGAKAPRNKQGATGGDYLVELTTFHVRPRGRL